MHCAHAMLITSCYLMAAHHLVVAVSMHLSSFQGTVSVASLDNHCACIKAATDVAESEVASSINNDCLSMGLLSFYGLFDASPEFRWSSCSIQTT